MPDPDATGGAAPRLRRRRLALELAALDLAPDAGLAHVAAAIGAVRAAVDELDAAIARLGDG